MKILRKKHLNYQLKGLIYSTAILLAVYNPVRSFASIVGSPHDFSYAAYSHADGEICKVCHVPHNAKSTQVPLWRGSLTSNGTYNLYSSSTLNASVGQPSAKTRACLSCHDSTLGRGMLTGSCLDCHSFHGSTLDLSLHHPVSFTYDTALTTADGELHDPGTTTVSQLGGKTIQQSMLFEGKMECPSCHDVHATKGDSATASKLLLVANNHSRLCLTCHNK